MPEGDTVKKLALSLQDALLEEPLTRCYVRGVHRAQKWSGQRILAIETRGKHTLFHIDNGFTIRVHLKMHGMWRVFSNLSPASSAYPIPKDRIALLFGRQNELYVCADTLDVEIFPKTRQRFHPRLSTLGPDLIDPQGVDFDRIIHRARNFIGPELSLGDLLLEQRVAGGIGNVYKSELCWMGPWHTLDNPPSAFVPATQAHHPQTPSNRLLERDLRGYFQRAAELLAANLGPWWRCTRVDRRRHPAPREELYVYGRKQQACPRCGSLIARTLAGDAARVSYFCPRCQPLDAGGPTG